MRIGKRASTCSSLQAGPKISMLNFGVLPSLKPIETENGSLEDCRILLGWFIFRHHHSLSSLISITQKHHSPLITPHSSLITHHSSLITFHQSPITHSSSLNITLTIITQHHSPYISRHLIISVSVGTLPNSPSKHLSPLLHSYLHSSMSWV